MKTENVWRLVKRRGAPGWWSPCLVAAALLPAAGLGQTTGLKLTAIRQSRYSTTTDPTLSVSVGSHRDVFHVKGAGVYWTPPGGTAVKIFTASPGQSYGPIAAGTNQPPNVFAVMFEGTTGCIMEISPGQPPRTVVLDDPDLIKIRRILYYFDYNSLILGGSGGKILSYDAVTGAKQSLAQIPGSLVDFTFVKSFPNALACVTGNPDGTANLGVLDLNTMQWKNQLSSLPCVELLQDFSGPSFSVQLMLSKRLGVIMFPTNSMDTNITSTIALTNSVEVLAPSPCLQPTAWRIYDYRPVRRWDFLGEPSGGQPFSSFSSGYDALRIPSARLKDPYVGLAFLLPFQVTSPPPYLTAYAGLNATLTVGTSVVNYGLPLYYQWSQNQVPIAGATNASLTFSNLQPADAGVYTVCISLAPGDTNLDTVVSDAGLSVLAPYTYAPVYRGVYYGVAAGYSPAGAGAYLSDTLGSRIGFLDSSNLFTTLAGTDGGFGYQDGVGPTAKFATPEGIAVDGATNLYVADYNNHVIRKVSATGGSWVTSTILGQYHTNTNGQPVGGWADGIGTNALFSHPMCVAVDGAGNIFVGDGDSNVVRMATPDPAVGYRVTTLAGTPGRAGYADGTNNTLFNGLYGIATDGSSNVFVADKFNNVVRRIDPSGQVSTIAGLRGNIGSAPGGDGVGGAARFSAPDGISMACDGSLLVTDAGYGTIRRMVRQGPEWLVTTAGYGPFSQPRAASDDCMGTIYVSDPGLYGQGKETVLRMVAGDSPVITAQPQGQTAPEGGAVTLSVTATNSSPMTYQWLFNGVALPGQTNPTLPLTGLGRTNEGVYQTVVSATNGALVSLGALVRVLLRPVLQPPVPLGTNGAYTLLMLDSDGGLPDDLERLTVQWRTNLPSGIDTNWQSLSSFAYLTTNGYVGVNDTNPPSGTRFYQVLKY